MTPLTVYADENYNGITLGLNIGQYPSVANVGIPNDSVTSLRVAAFTKVVLYENDEFTGASITLLGPIDIPNLKYYAGGFNDRVSSIQVINLPPTLDFQAKCCRGINDAASCGKYSPGSAACATTLSQYCGTHMNESECQSYCRANSSVCDAYVNSYCANYPSDPFCACIRSPAQVKGIVNPKCVDSKCLTSGYLTKKIKNANCPSIVDCSIQTSLVNNGVLLSYTVPIQQNCGNNATPTPVTPPVITPTDNNTSLSARAHILLLFLFFVIIAIFGGVLLFNTSDSNVMPGINESV